MKQVPFTISADLDLGGRVEAYKRATNADVTIARGTVPDRLKGDVNVLDESCEVNTDQIILRFADGLRILVEGGSRITYETKASEAERHIQLFLLGSAWGALAYQRGLLPIHASAVIDNGVVSAFTGHSGAGKSTLVAGLAGRGRMLFADDVLMIDPKSLHSGAVCYAGQKDLKLWSKAFDLVPANRKSNVSETLNLDKFYAAVDNQSDATVGRLQRLFVLVERQPGTKRPLFEIETLSGAESILELKSSIYRPQFAEAIVGRKILYSWLAGLVRHVTVAAYYRPHLAEYFDQSVAFVDKQL